MTGPLSPFPASDPRRQTPPEVPSRTRRWSCDARQEDPRGTKLLHTHSSSFHCLRKKTRPSSSVDINSNHCQSACERTWSVLTLPPEDQNQRRRTALLSGAVGFFVHDPITLLRAGADKRTEPLYHERCRAANEGLTSASADWELSFGGLGTILNV